ncbi:hypothetical protein [Nostoc sp. TCL26-01]|uniref:hypothetical protein n=1 Tax=Nostoc sp. TCL26-01 TaxID=2576904 RepID=UPI0015C068B3|nr:hypothetical protein [Nostoc sp. TCL26-01]QLE55426.1 hypothetical protein FD725_07795 [Nostoc sp. TCL26-01]
MLKILVDADLILNAVMNRTDLTEDVRELLEKSHPSIQIHLTNVGLQKISTYAYCLGQHQIPEMIADWLQQKMQICAVDKNLLQQARYSPLKDFESAVELVCLRHYKLDAIITHQQEDFIEAANQFCIWSFSDLWLRAYLEIQLQATNHI